MLFLFSIVIHLDASCRKHCLIAYRDNGEIQPDDHLKKKNRVHIIIAKTYKAMHARFNSCFQQVGAETLLEPKWEIGCGSWYS